MAGIVKWLYNKDGVMYLYPYEVYPNSTWMLSLKRSPDGIEASRNEQIIFITKSILYIPGILMQILALIFLTRGNSGYSKSAKFWFLVVIGCDFGSNGFRLCELALNDMSAWYTTDLFADPYHYPHSGKLRLLMWGMYDYSHLPIAMFFCTFFMSVLQIPFFMSPIALSFGGLLRSYSVKFPLRAKAVLTRKLDLVLMLVGLAASIVLATMYSYLSFYYSYAPGLVKMYGMEKYYGRCMFPLYAASSADKVKTLTGFIMMLAFSFTVCASNLASAIVIIIVLYYAKQARKTMMSSNHDNSGNAAEIKATAMLLGMNIVLVVCFFVSRVIMVFAADPSYYKHVGFNVVFTMEKVASLLIALPYLLNSVFVVGLNRKFYEHFLPCLRQSKTKSATATASMSHTKEVTTNDDKPTV